MERIPPKPEGASRARGKGPESRDERLKAALRANLARRKAQARARNDTDTGEGGDNEE